MGHTLLVQSVMLLLFILRFSQLCALNVSVPGHFFNHQKAFLLPTILWHWRSEQKTLVEHAKLSGKAIVLGGDMRADSPGLIFFVDI